MQNIRSLLERRACRLILGGPQKLLPLWLSKTFRQHIHRLFRKLALQFDPVSEFVLSRYFLDQTKIDESCDLLPNK